MLIALAANGAVCRRPASLLPVVAWVASGFDIRCSPGSLPAGAAAMANGLTMVLIPFLLLRIVTNPSHLHAAPRQAAIVSARLHCWSVASGHRRETGPSRSQ